MRSIVGDVLNCLNPSFLVTKSDKAIYIAKIQAKLQFYICKLMPIYSVLLTIKKHNVLMNRTIEVCIENAELHLSVLQ